MMQSVTPTAAYEAAGRAFFRNLFGSDSTGQAELCERIGGKVAARYHALRNWDAVELEGFEEAKHLKGAGWPDAVYLWLLLSEIADDPAAAYQSMWSSVVEIAEVDWEAIDEIAQRILRDGRADA